MAVDPNQNNGTRKSRQLRESSRRLQPLRPTRRGRGSAGHRPQNHRQRRHRRFRLQVRRPGSASSSFRAPTGEVTVQPGDVVDVMIDHGRAARRLRPALAHARRAPAHLGQPGKGLPGTTGHFRPRAGPRQGRPGGGCGNQGLHARLAGRSAPGAQPGFADRPGHPGQDHQAQPPPRQRSGFAQDWRWRKRSTRARAPRWSIWRKARWSPAW